MPVSKRLPAGLRTPQGRIVFRDEAVNRLTGQPTGLQRACIMDDNAYPDIETWMRMLSGARALLYRYTERQTVYGLACYLWLYWKED